MANHATDKRPRICLVGLKCYDLLSDANTPRYIGGIENQMALLARGMADRGFPVSFVTYDHGQPDAIVHNGVRIYKAYEKGAGIPGVRFLSPRWTGLCAALCRADADVYYQMGAGCETGQVAIWCRTRRRRFIFATASDADCVLGLPLLKNRREESLYRWGLKKATVVISQTRTQRQLLLDHFGVPSKVFNILSPDPPNDAPVPGERRRILWVGRISPEKRPHLLLDVIRQLPGHAVDVVGDANADTAYARGFRQQAQNHPFLVLHGRISNETLARMYGEAFLLVGTSETEGFPITFIEAWSRGIPVVSTFDPDGVIRANGLGYVAEGADGIVSYVKRVVQSPDLWSEASKVARQYYLANHAPGVCLPRYERLFLEVAGTDMSRMVGAMSS